MHTPWEQIAQRHKWTTFVQHVLEIASGFQARASQVDKRIRVSSQATFVSADPDRLRQVLTNLLENALKYASTEVKVTLHPDSRRWRRLATQRFDPCVRPLLRQRRVAQPQLGRLALIELHRERVTARNLEPRGAEFTVVLPLSA